MFRLIGAEVSTFLYLSIQVYSWVALCVDLFLPWFDIRPSIHWWVCPLQVLSLPLTTCSCLTISGLVLA